MNTTPPLSAEALAATPPEVLAHLHWQSAVIEHLSARIADLETKLGKDSTNSSKPSSTAHPHAKTIPPKKKSRKRRGGQKGHTKQQRPLLPTTECQTVIPVIPTECRRCGKTLSGVDEQPLRHQVWEMPVIEPQVTEYQRHRLICSCGCSTCGELPAGVPSGQAGPRLVAFAGLLMACFRQSKRRAAQFLGLILHQPASAAWMVVLQNRVAEAVQPAYDELAKALPAEPVLAIDESPTKEGTAKAWVWTFVALTFTFFACRTSRKAEVPQQLLGQAFPGVIHCDRARMYWSLGRLQWCWAHLKRDFQALIDSHCTVRRRLGYDLMRPTKELFEIWRKVRDGTLTREQFVKQMEPLRVEVENYLLRGYCNRRTGGFCKELWEHRVRLWTFVEREGVEPTNNAAEQALRHAVIWRKLSFGTQSAKGSQFVERLLTVIETCRRQKRNAFTWLTDTVQNHFLGLPAVSLLPGV